MSVNQIVMMVTDLPAFGPPVFRVPAHGNRSIEDVRSGCILSPGYPHQYPNNADGSIKITSRAAEVSLPHQ